MSQGIAGHVATTGQILNIPGTAESFHLLMQHLKCLKYFADAYDDPNFNQAIDKKTGYRTKAILCMPIKADDQVIGVLQLINKVTGAGVFTTDDEDVMMIFLSIAGPILAGSNLYAQIQGKSKEKGDGVDKMPSEMPRGNSIKDSHASHAPKLSGFAEGADDEEEA
jgi:transcriptional regulator with GAF, ATPase, and Fis domain